MPWDIVSSDFGGEETVNFGPREESGSALYQIDTLATISSRDKVDNETFVSFYQLLFQRKFSLINIIKIKMSW